MTLRSHFGSSRGYPQRISAAWGTVLCHLEQANKVHSEFASVLCARFGMPIEKVPVSKFDEPEPGAVFGAVAEPHQMSVGWNSVKQHAAIWGLYAETFFLFDATASPACLVAATALPVAFGGFALHGPSPVGFCGSCFQHVPMGAAMVSAAMLAAIAFLCMGFSSMTTGWEKDLRGLEPAAFDAIATLAASLPLVVDYAATAGPAALVPGFFAFAFAALSAIFAFRKRTSPSVSLEDDQDLDDFEADHNVWTCHFALDVFTVMQHGLPGALVDVEAVLSAAAPDLDDDKVTTQAAAASGAEVVLAFPLDDEVVSLSEEFFPQFFEGDTVNLAALSKAVNVSQEFLAGYVFEHGLGQPVSEIQAAAALDSDQLVKQAVAAREEEVSHFQKLSPLLQEKIQFFVKGDGATRVCHGQPSEPLSSVLELASGTYACHNGKCLDVGSSIETLGLFPGCTVRLYSRLRGVALWTFRDSGSVAFVEQFGVSLRETNATNVGSRAVLAGVLPGALLTLIPKVWLVVCVRVFPVLRLLTWVWCMAL